jgi:hypothetical protein
VVEGVRPAVTAAGAAVGAGAAGPGVGRWPAAPGAAGLLLPLPAGVLAGATAGVVLGALAGLLAGALAGAGVGSRGAIAAKHLAGLPAGQPHEVGFAATLGEPGMRERMTELVRMEPWQAGLVAPAAHELLHPPGSQPATLAEPEPGEVASLCRARTRR